MAADECGFGDLRERRRDRPCGVIPTRDAALGQLRDFVPRAGKYRALRNFDLGPARRSHVSGLSPYLRSRVIHEAEVSRAVLGRYAFGTVEKFLQEVAWRTYWKGWLEMRPAVWDAYREGVAADVRRLDESERLRAARDRAVRGETGIECFDFWARELAGRGYLHNHARMWFASIWIFTLRLPWRLGADFFLRHLLDGDPASNTLSWRWVAGLHTRGKPYLARASNIAEFTDGRFDPRGQLDERAGPLEPDGEFSRQTLRLPEPPPVGGRLGWLLSPDDLSPPPEDLGIVATGGIMAGFESDAAPVVDFRRGVLADALARRHGEWLADFGALEDWTAAHRLDGVALALPTVGPWRDALASHPLPVPTHPVVGEWDRSLWPRATAGFFRLKKRLPEHFAALDCPRQPELWD